MLFSGWQGDLTPIPTATAPFTATNETLNVPIARNSDGSPVTGPYLVRIPGPSGNTFALAIGFGGPTRYPPLTLDTTQASLVRVPPETISGQQTGPATPIASADWAFADCRTAPFPGTPDPTRISSRAASTPRYLYELIYTAKDPPVLGLGLAATRDIVSFFRHASGTTTARTTRCGRCHTSSPRASRSRATSSRRSPPRLQRGRVRPVVWDGAERPHRGPPVADQLPLRAARAGRRAVRAGQRGRAVVGRLRGHGPRPAGRPACSTAAARRAPVPKVFETFGSAEFWGLRMSPSLVGTSADRGHPAAGERPPLLLPRYHARGRAGRVQHRRRRARPPRAGGQPESRTRDACGHSDGRPARLGRQRHRPAAEPLPAARRRPLVPPDHAAMGFPAHPRTSRSRTTC